MIIGTSLKYICEHQIIIHFNAHVMQHKITGNTKNNT